MITYSIIQKSQIESAYRLDAGYYQPEYLDIKDKLYKSPKLTEISKKITDFGAYSQMNFVEYADSGVRFLRNQDVGELFIDESDPIFVPYKTYQKLSLKLEEYDIITPRVGTLGNAAIVLRKHLPTTANQNLSQIKPDTSKVDPFYLTVFLCSRFGRKQFERFATGNVQPWLNLKNIKSLKVFIPAIIDQSTIKNLAEQSLKQYEISKSFYSKAENLLLEELGLKDFEPEEKLSYIVKFSDVKSAQRADADYFQPKYKKIMERIEIKNVKSLDELVSIKKGIEPGSGEYTDKGKLFIRVSNLSKHDIIDKNQKYLDNELYRRLKKDFEPKTGEILLTKDATPGIACVLKEPLECIIAGGILRLKLKQDVEVEYLALCINSIICQMQIERDAGGSVISHWKPEPIKKLQVPILPEPAQKKIADLVIRSQQARRKAEELLEKAKRKVEEFIEGK